MLSVQKLRFALVHAVDAAGVHPLLLAIGSERYTPYYENKQPQELLHDCQCILGTGQLSLAKFYSLPICLMMKI